jgi:hypothetical protein
VCGVAGLGCGSTLVLSRKARPTEYEEHSVQRFHPSRYYGMCAQLMTHCTRVWPARNRHKLIRRGRGVPTSLWLECATCLGGLLTGSSTNLTSCPRGFHESGISAVLGAWKDSGRRQTPANPVGGEAAQSNLFPCKSRPVCHSLPPEVHLFINRRRFSAERGGGGASRGSPGEDANSATRRQGHRKAQPRGFRRGYRERARRRVGGCARRVTCQRLGCTFSSAAAVFPPRRPPWRRPRGPIEGIASKGTYLG